MKEAPKMLCDLHVDGTAGGLVRLVAWEDKTASVQIVLLNPGGNPIIHMERNEVDMLISTLQIIRSYL